MQCRICLEEEDESSMISPCLCSGTMKYVHIKCLKTWMEYGHVTCDICQSPYSVGRIRFPIRVWLCYATIMCLLWVFGIDSDHIIVVFVISYLLFTVVLYLVCFLHVTVLRVVDDMRQIVDDIV